MQLPINIVVPGVPWNIQPLLALLSIANTDLCTINNGQVREEMTIFLVRRGRL